MQEVYFGELQHGHLEQVGYDTYISILQEVIKEAKGEKIEEEKEIYIDLNISQHIPDEYIKSETIKIDIYQEIFSSNSEEELEEIRLSIIDRFGKFGVEIENLFNVAKIKLKSKEKNIDKIIQKNNRIYFYLPKEYEIKNLESLIRKYKHNMKFSESKQNYIYIDFVNYEKNQKAIMGEIKKVNNVMEKKHKNDIINFENIDRDKKNNIKDKNDFNKKTNDILEFLEML